MSKGWQVLMQVTKDGYKTIDLLPVDDIVEHEPGEACWCRKELKDLPNDFVQIKHKAADNREEKERQELIQELSKLFTTDNNGIID